MCGADAIHMKCGGIAQAIFNTDRGIQGLGEGVFARASGVKMLLS